MSTFAVHNNIKSHISEFQGYSCYIILFRAPLLTLSLKTKSAIFSFVKKQFSQITFEKSLEFCQFISVVIIFSRPVLNL